MTRSLLFVFGTRPEAIKVAPLVLAARAAEDFRPIVVVTGQHRAILDEVLETFGITPDYDLNLLRERQTLTHVTTRVLEGLEPILRKEQPAAVVVQGDTTTTFAAGLAAFYQQIPVVHVEAGLRSGDQFSPYPEEANRRMTSQYTSVHLCPTAGAADHLRREGFPPDRIFTTGNTVIDALQQVLHTGATSLPPEIADFVGTARVVLITSHRRESWNAGLAGVARGLARVASEHPDCRFVFPMHPNPIVHEQMRPQLAPLANMLLVDPQPYPAFCALLGRADIVLTDSGGVQEEAPSLGKPVLVTRENTERPEAVASGAALLIGTDSERVYTELTRLLDDRAHYEQMANAVSPYGDGRAAARSLQALRHVFDAAARPQDFEPA